MLINMHVLVYHACKTGSVPIHDRVSNVVAVQGIDADATRLYMYIYMTREKERATDREREREKLISMICNYDMDSPSL